MPFEYEFGGDGPPRLEPGPLPDSIRSAAARAMADLSDAAGVRLEGGFLPDEERADLGRFLVCAEDGRALYGFGIPLGVSEAELTVAVAEGIQEHLFEVPGANGLVHPRCPGHTHAAVAREGSGRAWWVCPESGRSLRQVGSG